MTDLSGLLALSVKNREIQRIVTLLKQREELSAVAPGSARAYLSAVLYRALGRPVLFLTSQPEHARSFSEQLQTWLPSGDIMLFPEPDMLPYERMASDAATETDRLRVLEALEKGNPLVVTSIPALVSRTIDASAFRDNVQSVRLGMDIRPFDLLTGLEKLGYRAENVVELPGMMSHRGGIIDIWPATHDLPVRLEFFGDTIDSIRRFDPDTQRSNETIGSVGIGPATELLAMKSAGEGHVESVQEKLDLSGCTRETVEQYRTDFVELGQGKLPREAYFYAPLFSHGSLLDFLPDDAVIIYDEISALEQAADMLDVEAEQLRAEKMELGELPENFPQPHFTWNELQPKTAGRPSLHLEAWGEERTLDFKAAPSYLGQLPAFMDKTSELLAAKKRLIVVSHQADRLADLLEDRNIIAVPVETVAQPPGPGSMVLVRGSLPEGWVLNDDTYLFSDAEIFGFVKQRRLVRKRPAPKHKLTVELIPGEYVVHIEHGIGKFEGVKTMSSAGTDKEFLVIEYAAGDTLYVPTDQIDRVDRYVGSGEKTPVLSRLGTQEWIKTRQKAKDAASVLAKELISLYAAREIVKGHSFGNDTVWQQELEAAFPYVETHDQAVAIQDVKEDMERDRPMDRLVCGDVGYGKTEVAVRAAFKAVMDGCQVAVLVPTTVLAQQHYTTFAERLAAFPVKVEMLSRFRTPHDQRRVIDALGKGGVDICIGTHRLLQKDVRFKDLGLLVIDEEQRFGVNHKEHFKQLRQEIDVLTLSATPIPRTLHMSLAGVRDMSTMQTAPNERLPVKTYVAEFNDHLVREAILREMERNGQVFFVHNRVQSIAIVAEHIRELVPEAKVAVGHGQMHEDHLEKVMSSFSRGEVDILVCTTIIESGLDMPNANTLIVNRADKFGLTQLYQLRGRVGRGGNLAYAYFLYDKGRRLTDIARKRLQTIYEATELGAGFSIAMKDLEIRGAGSILGHRQSGHITAVGFALYTRLLAEAVEEQKALNEGRPRPQPRLPAPSVDLPLDAYIPEDYVADVETRLEIYRKLADADAPEDLDELTKECEDRFGPLPKVVENLYYAVKLKWLGARAGIESIGTEDGMIVIRRFTGLPFDVMKFTGMLRDGITVGRTQVRVDYRKLGNQWRTALEGVIRGLLT